MAKTKQQLSTRVLEQMRIVGVGEDPPAEDAARIEGRYDSKLAEWRERGLVWWTNTDRSTAEIPDEVFPVLADLMENEAGHSYGIENPVMQRLQVEERMLLRLARFTTSGPSGEATETSSY